MSKPPEYLWITCQVGAEPAVKAELAARWPAFRFAYSRPGLVTFKLPLGHTLAATADVGSVFARAHGFSLGKATGADDAQRAQSAWQLAGDAVINRVHVWPRDVRPVGDHGYVPAMTAACANVEAMLREAAPAELSLPTTLTVVPAADETTESRLTAAPAELGEQVLDCIVLEPDEWWIGWHSVGPWESQWPGGLRPFDRSPSVVSRAYYKMHEALDWSKLPVRPGQQVAELGCAPGGSCQALLERGLNVVGIDPAEVDAAVLAHPRFTHLRKRGHEVRRREFRKMRWLTADMNVAPQYTLDTVEAIVTHAEVEVQGLLLTLKLLDGALAAEVPAYLERVRRWGYAQVRARQLQHNRREICVAALR